MAPPKHSKITIDRTSEPPLVFEGFAIAAAKSPSYRRHLVNPTHKTHWFECEVYETAGGKYVVAIHFRFSGDLYRERQFDEAWVYDSTEGVLDYLDNLDFAGLSNGYPALDKWADRQAALNASLRDDADLMIEDIEAQLNKLREPEVVK